MNGAPDYGTVTASRPGAGLEPGDPRFETDGTV